MSESQFIRSDELERDAAALLARTPGSNLQKIKALSAAIVEGA